MPTSAEIMPPATEKKEEERVPQREQDLLRLAHHEFQRPEELETVPNNERFQIAFLVTEVANQLEQHVPAIDREQILIELTQAALDELPNTTPENRVYRLAEILTAKMDEHIEKSIEEAVESVEPNYVAYESVKNDMDAVKSQMQAHFGLTDEQVSTIFSETIIETDSGLQVDTTELDKIKLGLKIIDAQSEAYNSVQEKEIVEAPEIVESKEAEEEAESGTEEKEQKAFEYQKEVESRSAKKAELFVLNAEDVKAKYERYQAALGLEEGDIDQQRFEVIDREVLYECKHEAQQFLDRLVFKAFDKYYDYLKVAHPDQNPADVVRDMIDQSVLRHRKNNTVAKIDPEKLLQTLTKLHEDAMRHNFDTAPEAETGSEEEDMREAVARVSKEAAATTRKIQERLEGLSKADAIAAKQRIGGFWNQFKKIKDDPQSNPEDLEDWLKKYKREFELG